MKNDSSIMASGLQGFRASGLQGFRASGLQGFRDHIADSLRGWAIICVVIGHVIIWLHRSGIIFSHDLTIRYWVYSFHMPLMFMISGYVHGLTDRHNDGHGWSCHAGRNLVSIYLPYLWVSYFGWAVSLFFFRGTSNPINYNMAQFSELFRIPYIGFREYWFLCTLFQVKLVHIAFECRTKNHIYNTIFWLIVFAAMTYFKPHLPIYVSRFSFGMYFHAGWLMKTKALISTERHPHFSVGVLLIAAGTILHFFPVFSGPLSGTASAVCSCLGFFTVFYALKVKPALLVLAGSTSMVMFILHDYVIFAMALVFKFTGFLSGEPFAASVLTFTLAVGVSLLTVKLYQNVRCFRWIEYIFYPGKLLKKKKA